MENLKPELSEKQDVLAWALEKEENEMKVEEELDKFILSNLCSDILEEVMDTSSEHIVMARTALSSKQKNSIGRKPKPANVSR